MNYFDLYKDFLVKYNKHDDPNINNDFYNLLFFYSKKIKNLSSFLMNRFNEIDFKEHLSQFYFDLYLMGRHQFPVAYLIKMQYFYGLKFFITKGALIPRSETEFLVDKIVLENCSSKKTLRILDLCAGVGNIGLTLAKNLKARVTLVEKYSIPFRLIHTNLHYHHLNYYVNVQKKDIRNFLITNQKKYDIVIMNPPYINYNDNLLENSVKKYEPVSALYTKDHGLYYYKLVLNYVPYLMKKKIVFYFEIGYNQKALLTNFLRRIWWRNIFNLKYKFWMDYHGKYRYLKVVVKEK